MRYRSLGLHWRPRTVAHDPKPFAPVPTPQPATHPVCGARTRQRFVTGADLPVQTDTTGRHPSARRRARHTRAAVQREGATRPALGSRQQAGGRRQYRCRHRRQVARRRLHAGDGNRRDACHQRRLVRQDALRYGEELQPDFAGSVGAQLAGGPQRPAGQERSGADRLHEGEPEQTVFRFARRWHLGACVGRTL